MKFNRRQFLTRFGVGLAAAIATPIAYPNRSLSQPTKNFRFGSLRRDPNGLLDLPEGFQYRILSRTGNLMKNGERVPSYPDGMAAFPGSEPGTTILIRNHEIYPPQPNEVIVPVKGDRTRAYDDLMYGGTTTLIVGKDRSLQQEWVSLTGTCRNCAGGPTPWNSWLSCEESVATPEDKQRVDRHLFSKPHGYVFEVPASEEQAIAQPLVAMGRFFHEAAAVDPTSGIVYQTEDRPDGCFYRFLPTEPGNLAAGGKLEALKIPNTPKIDTGKGFLRMRESFKVDWVAITEPDPLQDTVRYEAQSRGSAIFRRGEGCWYADDSIYFTCTSGGRAGCGQVWRYHPQSNRLELFVESPHRSVLDFPDNITITPFGDLLLCEDGSNDGENSQFLVGVTPGGQIYPFGRNALNMNEFAGACFAPDGKTLFVNIQDPGITLAIWGPWPS